MYRMVLFAAMLMVTSPAWGQPSARTGDDEQAIRRNIAAYVAAFERGDVQALAAQWANDATWISPDGDRIEGRGAIQAAMKDYFAEGRGQSLTLSDTKIRLLSPSVAVEEGRARVDAARRLGHNPGRRDRFQPSAAIGRQ